MKKTNKNISKTMVISLTAVVAVAAPIATVVSCGSKKDAKSTNGQAGKTTTTPAKIVAKEITAPTFKLADLKLTGINGNGSITVPKGNNEYTVKVSKTTALSNGDTITITVEPQKGFKFKGSKQIINTTFSVSGLNAEIPTFTKPKYDIKGFEGEFNFDKTLFDVAGTDVTFTKATNLKNNDTVTVTYKAKPGHAFAKGQVTSFDYTIKGLSKKIDSTKLLTLKDLNLKGLDGAATITLPKTSTEWTVTADKSTQLTSNGVVKLTYTAKTGFAFEQQGKPVQTITKSINLSKIDKEIKKPKMPVIEVNPAQASALTTKIQIIGLEGEAKATILGWTSTEYTIKLSKNDKISNGDKIDAILTANTGFKFLDGSKQPTPTITIKGITVKGLVKGIQIPTLKDSDFAFAGVNGKGKVTFNKSGTGSHYKMKMTKTGASNGGAIQVTLTPATGYGYMVGGKVETGAKVINYTIPANAFKTGVAIPTKPALTFTGVSTKAALVKPLTDTKEYTVTYSKETGIANGDKITITLTTKTGFVFEQTGTLKSKIDFTYTAKGLVEITTAPTDVEQRLNDWLKKQGKFDGTAAFAIKDLFKSKEFTATANNMTGLSNNDKITFTLTANKGFTFIKAGAEVKTVTIDATIGASTLQPDPLGGMFNKDLTNLKKETNKIVPQWNKVLGNKNDDNTILGLLEDLKGATTQLAFDSMKNTIEDVIAKANKIVDMFKADQIDLDITSYISATTPGKQATLNQELDKLRNIEKELTTKIKSIISLASNNGVSLTGYLHSFK